MKVSKAIEASGYGFSGDIGGLPKTTYYTPDGRTIESMPNIVTGNLKGKQVTIDLNLKRGWLLSPPQVLKPYCEGCTRWHDTKEEVKACIARQKAFADKWDKWARKGMKKEAQTRDATIETLSKELKDMKDMIKKLAEAKVG